MSLSEQQTIVASHVSEIACVTLGCMCVDADSRDEVGQNRTVEIVLHVLQVANKHAAIPLAEKAAHTLNLLVVGCAENAKVIALSRDIMFEIVQLCRTSSSTRVTVAIAEILQYILREPSGVDLVRAAGAVEVFRTFCDSTDKALSEQSLLVLRHLGVVFEFTCAYPYAHLMGGELDLLSRRISHLQRLVRGRRVEHKFWKEHQLLSNRLQARARATEWIRECTASRVYDHNHHRREIAQQMTRVCWDHVIQKLNMRSEKAVARDLVKVWINHTVTQVHRESIRSQVTVLISQWSNHVISTHLERLKQQAAEEKRQRLLREKEERRRREEEKRQAAIKVADEKAALWLGELLSAIDEQEKKNLLESTLARLERSQTKVKELSNALNQTKEQSKKMEELVIKLTRERGEIDWTIREGKVAMKERESLAARLEEKDRQIGELRGRIRVLQREAGL